jgi:hypothetical protein
MQVLVLVAQNAVPYPELGVATSGATFFRSIGGSFGVAIFGAIFSNVLVGNMARDLHGVSLPKGFNAADVTPAILDRLPQAVHHGIALAYTHSLHTVFLLAAPVALVAFFAALLIPHVELRTAVATPSVPSTETPEPSTVVSGRASLRDV